MSFLVDPFLSFFRLFIFVHEILKKILEEHRKNCEQQGKYVEAEIAKNRLLEIKAHEESRQKGKCCNLI